MHTETPDLDWGGGASNMITCFFDFPTHAYRIQNQCVLIEYSI